MIAVTEPQLEAPVVAGPSKQPKNRCPDSKSALTLIKTQCDDDKWQRRVEAYRAIEDAYDRLPPDSDSDLAGDGLSWVANVDWGGMKAGINDGAEIDWNLLTQPETYIRLVSRSARPGIGDSMAILERLDKEMLDGWTDWETELEMMVHNRRSFGLGIFHFPQPYGWHFRSLHPANLILPPRARANPDSWAWCGIKTEFSIVDLMERLETPLPAKKLGWNIENIRKALAKFAADDGKAAWFQSLCNDVEGYIHGFKANDLLVTHENKSKLDGYIFYVKEWNGRVSEHLLVNDDEIGYLYSGVGRHKSMADLIALFPLQLGQGYIERIRGYGLEMLPFHDLENRALNHGVDTMMITSGLLLQSKQGDDWKRLQEGVFLNGPFVGIPEDLTLMNPQFGSPAQGLLAMQREIERRGNFRNRSFGGADYSNRDPEQSATAAKIHYQQGTASRTYEVARLYRQAQNFHRIRVMKMIDPNLTTRCPGGEVAIAMLKEAMSKGVSPDDIASIKGVKARTIFGDGDPVNQFLALMDLKEFFGKLPASGQRKMQRHVFNARLRDPELVRELMGPDKPQDDPEFTRQRWRAQVENNTFETSDTRQDLADGDNHLIHAGEHTIFAEEVMQRLKAGILAEEDALQRIMRAQSHTEGHLAALAADPFAVNELKDLRRRWADLTNSNRQLAQHIQAKKQQEQARAIEEMRNPRPSVKDQETMLTEKAKRQAIAEETALNIQLRKEKHAAELEMLRSGAITKTQLDIINSLPNGNATPAGTAG